ncbi:MAG: hypothetical protein D6719_02700 [Candidatus Dadabacteria bacterium]|nr:MAG: hypothetical protein D6719_02700 [Candidatus Dadabacteria bacterium]
MLEPVASAILKAILAKPYIRADETTLKVQNREKKGKLMNAASLLAAHCFCARLKSGTASLQLSCRRSICVIYDFANTTNYYFHQRSLNHKRLFPLLAKTMRVQPLNCDASL